MAILIFWESPAVKRHPKLKFVPAPLLVVVLGVLVNELYGAVLPGLFLDATHRVNLPIPESLGSLIAALSHPDFSQITNAKVYTVAFTLAVVASLETLLSVEATDKLDPEKRVTPTNRELKAQGLGNILAGLIGGIPVTQVVVRSAANVNAGGKTRVASFTHGLLLLLCAAVIPAVVNRIPLACLAAILLQTGYKLARVSLFRGMYRAGLWQFVPFLVTILGIVVTDLLKGIVLGLAVGIFNVLMYNYRLDYFMEDKGDGRYVIVLSEHTTFLNKAAVMNALRAIPSNSEVTIDASHSFVVDPDVKEVIESFAVHAALDGITIVVKGLDDVEKRMKAVER